MELCCQRLLLAVRLEFCIQRPVFFRNECIDLVLAVADDAQGYRLYSSGAQPALYFCPQKRADLVTHNTIQNTSGLLCVDKIHIDIARLL